MSPPSSSSSTTTATTTRSTKPTTTRSNGGRMNTFSRYSKMAALACLVTLGWMPQPGKADIYCTQKGSDTIRIGATVKFGWNDTATYPIDTFRLDLYCIENDKFMQTITTLNTTSSVSPQTWVVNQTITAQTASCPSNQYQGRFDWNYTDPTTGVLSSGSANCKSMLLVGPGSVPPVGGVGGVNPDPSQEQPPEDPDTSGPIEITDKTKKIVIGVGCAVGALVLAGIVGFYYIRFSNKRAVQAQASKKLREPLNSSPYGGGSGAGSTLAVGGGASGTRYNELSSVTASIAGYSPVQQQQHQLSQQNQQLQMTELNTQRLYSDNDSGSIPSRPQTPIAAAHTSYLGASSSGTSLSHSSALLPSVAAQQERPTSLLTSSFTPPPEPRSNLTHQQRQQREAEYEQQRLFEEHQVQQQHQMQQQQQQQNYTSYQY